MSGWRSLKRFSEGKPQYGLNLSAESYVDDGIRFIRTTDITVGGSLTGPENAVYVSEGTFGHRHELREGDLLFSRSGSLGRCLRYRSEFGRATFAGYLVRFRPTGDTDARYVAYCAEAHFFQDAIRADAVSSTISNFNAERYAGVMLPWSHVVFQRAVADYLDAETAHIDALINKKRRLVELLEERYHAHAYSLLLAVAHESRVIPLGQVLERIIDYRGATPEKAEAGVPLLTATNIVDGRINMDASRQYVTEVLYAEWMRRGLPHSGDLLLTTEAPLGEVALIDDTKVALAQRLMLLRPRPEWVTGHFLLMYLRSSDGQHELLSRASGSTVMGVRTDRLRQVPVQVPSLDTQKDIVSKLALTANRVYAGSKLLREQIDLLIEHRRALITAAVTGELPVPGVAA